MIDSNVSEIKALLTARAIVGLKKYGVTTERTDLTTREWIQHAIEEACDLAVYLQRIKTDLDVMLEDDKSVMDIHISSTGVAVDQGYFWLPMEDAILDCKVQLLTKAGVAVYGMVTEKNRNDFEYWCPLPKKPV